MKRLNDVGELKKPKNRLFVGLGTRVGWLLGLAFYHIEEKFWYVEGEKLKFSKVADCWTLRFGVN